MTFLSVIIDCYATTLPEAGEMGSEYPHTLEYFVRVPHAVRYAGGATHMPGYDCEDGAVRDAPLAAALRRVRDQDGRERRSAAAIALFLGATAGYVVSSSGVSNEGGAMTSSRDGSLLALLLRAVSTVATASSASYWYIRRRRREDRLRLEEDQARAFFSKKSASGNKY